MRIYFTASIVGKRKYESEYRSIIGHMVRLGNQVVSDHIMGASETTINMETEKQREQFHKKLRSWILSSQCVVVETSFPSVSVGFEISLALQLNKPVLVLYLHEPPTLLSGYDSERLICERYTPQSLSALIEEYLNYVQSQSDHRFTFFISSKINHYLDRASRRKNVPKSVYLRQLIEDDQQKHASQ